MNILVIILICINIITFITNNITRNEQPIVLAAILLCLGNKPDQLCSALLNKLSRFKKLPNQQNSGNL